MRAATQARHFLVTYRWELVLFFGIPAIAGGTRHTVWWLWECDAAACWYWPNLIPGIVGLALVAGSYPFVRRQGRYFLTLLWTLELVSRSVFSAAYTVDVIRGAASPIGIHLFTVPLVSDTSVFVTVSNLIGCITILWFARQASRISTSHAFPFAGLALADSSFSVPQTFQVLPTTAFGGLVAAIYLTSQLGSNLLALVAMVRFETGGIVFRRIIIAALLGAVFWRSFWVFPALFASLGVDSFGQLFGESFGEFGMNLLARAMSFGLHYLLPFALIYLVRVRQPAPDADPAPDARPAPPNEER